MNGVGNGSAEKGCGNMALIFAQLPMTGNEGTMRYLDFKANQLVAAF